MAVKPSCKIDPDTHKDTDSARPGKSKAALMPFSVNLVHLTQDQINLYTKPRPAASPATPVVKPKAKVVKIKLHKLPLVTKQSVTVAPPRPRPSAGGVLPVLNILKHLISGHPLTVQSTT